MSHSSASNPATDRSARNARCHALTLERAHLDAAIFDLDGVVTRTAAQHARAWQQMFDEYLQQRGRREQRTYAPFDPQADYRRHLDGKPREDGTRSFLRARGIELPLGNPDDVPPAETLYALGHRKQSLFRELLAREGAAVFEPALALVRRLRAAGLSTAIVSSSRNCAAILRSIHASDLFDERVDGVAGGQRGLRGKPAPDYFLAAAAALGVAPRRTVVFEDAEAGVQAARAGGFALVVGVDRGGHADALRESGAHVVVDDLGAVEALA